MREVWEATDSFLADRPEDRSELQHVLDVDAQQTAWSFDDLDLDSGVFGELVSRGIVEKTEQGYHVADRAAVRAALNGDQPEPERASNRSIDISNLLPPRHTILPLLAVLGFVLLVRLLAYPSVFRGSDVVLLGNDPYFYRYWLFNSLSHDVSISNLPAGVTVGEPLLVAVLLGVTEFFGGSTSTGELVLAWYPVGAALVTAVVAYVLTCRLTGSRRAGLAAVTILAVTPVHAFRTSIGFADHHAFDYIWLAITVFATFNLVNPMTTSIAGIPQKIRTVGWTLVLGIGVAAQVLAWNAGPLLLLPLGVYGVARSAAAVKHNTSPLTDFPLAIGIGLGGVLSLAVHLAFGWQQLYIVLPALLLAGGLLLVFGLSEIAQRREYPAFVVPIGTIATAAVVLLIGFQLVPEFGVEFIQEIARLFGGDGSIAEVKSIFSPVYGTVTGPFFFFGLSLFFSLWYLVKSVHAAWSQNLRSWLLVGSYTVTLFSLALLQVRFAGELAMFAAIYSGVAIIDIAALIGSGDHITYTSQSGDNQTKHETDALLRVPGRQTIFAFGMIFLLVGGLGGIMSPLRINQLTVDDNTYNAATWMEAHSEKEGWEYRDNYVLSQWSDNRIYNSFVNNQSRSYEFAYQNYEEFMLSKNSSKRYRSLDAWVGFVVVDYNPTLNSSGNETMYNQLYNNWGSNTSHYRAVWASSDETKKVFILVPGATVSGTAPANSTVVARGVSEVNGSNVQVSYTTIADNDGTYQLIIPQPGTYSINNTTVTVSERDTTSGSVIQADN